jgi:O-antigen/teichoic acid export membrane protein
MEIKLLKLLPKIKLPKFVVDVASLMSSRVVMTSVDIIIGILVARILGPSSKGIMTTAIVIPVLVLNFADLGLGSTITYMMGKRIYDDQVLISTMTLLIFFTSLLGITSALLAYIITGFQVRYGWTIILICIAIIPARLVMTLNTGVLMAKNRITKLAMVNIIPNSIYFVGVMALLFFGSLRVELVLLSQVLSVIITAVYVLTLVRKYGNLIPTYISELFWNMLRKGVVYALATFVIGLNYSLDIVILEHMTNSKEVGIYSVGTSVAAILWWIPSVISTVNFSHSASSKDDMAHAKKTAVILRVVLWVAILPILLLYIFSPIVIPWVYGNAYYTSSIVVHAILPGVWAMLIFNILYGDLAGRGRPESALWVFSLAVVIDIALNIWWDPLFGAIGSAWASTVSYTLGGIIFGIVYARISNLRLRELFVIQRDDLKPLWGLIRKI